ncbi:MAG TPA: DegT/DnrJ/EryC1/StrS family aminotransferase [Candidatus Acidoferrum sp.]|jgi:dTDP-4-amino-4,6-dideoxygalactose transaminase|nr:DegT/DnrJ/EryC1/StrS family aminotransferase [Candidatus Acidoferrum sp.]
MRPKLPTADELLPYLRRIDEARWYSNYGPLLLELRDRFAAHFKVENNHVAIVANGTVALSAALVAAGARPGTKCLLPSWTFVGSAAAAWAANLQPHFVDVDPATWMLDPEQLRKRSDLKEVGAVMVVSAFGSPVDTAAWDAFTEDTGIPVIIDGAASFDTVASVPRARAGRSAVMISLHATKVFGVGEGGLLLSTDTALVERFNQVCNFGVWGSPAGQILGYNGKLSEYNAAVGLAMFETWPARRARVVQLTERYREILGGVRGIELVPGYGDGWVSCYCNIKTDAPAQSVIDGLAERGIETRRWWQSGVHVQKAYRDFPRDPLPVTERLASTVFGLPFSHDLDDTRFQRVIEGLKAAIS